MTPEMFDLAVLAYCRELHGSVTSGYRTVAHNVKVGGKPDSPHLVGLGADVVYDTTPMLMEAAHTASIYGLGVIRDADHDHLQPADWRA